VLSARQLFHGGCPDGFTAAYAAWLVLGDKATYIGIGHGKDKEENAGDLRGKSVAVLDFSFDAEATGRQLAAASQYVVTQTPRAACHATMKSCPSSPSSSVYLIAAFLLFLQVLDHHASAEENLKDLPEANKVFEMKMSGATLAWNFFHPGTPVPLLFRYVEDKDIWRWALHNSQAFGAAFELTAEIPGSGEIFKEDFALLDGLYRGGEEALQSLLSAGSTILRYQTTVIESHARRYTKRRLKQVPDQVCAVVNATTLASEIGNALAKEEGVNFALIFTQDSDCQGYRISLRSCFPAANQADVSKIAQLFGGGGHRAAAGCGYTGCAIEDLFLPIDQDPTQEAFRREYEAIVVGFARLCSQETAEPAPIPLPATLNSFERHLVHDLCKAHPMVSSESQGKGKERHIVLAKAAKKTLEKT